MLSGMRPPHRPEREDDAMTDQPDTEAVRVARLEAVAAVRAHVTDNDQRLADVIVDDTEDTVELARAAVGFASSLLLLLPGQHAAARPRRAPRGRRHRPGPTNLTRMVMRRHACRDDLGTRGRGRGISGPLRSAETSPPVYLSLACRVT